MNVLFLGAPGSGKGTQAKKIETQFSIPQISTGDLLRAETASGSDIGEELKIIMSSGKFVSDDIVLKLVSKKITSNDCKNGFILDGFPRNLSQASSLDMLLKDLSVSIERRIAAANDQISSAQAAAIREVRNKAITIAISAVEEVISSNIDSKKRSELIDSAVKEVEEKLH